HLARAARRQAGGGGGGGRAAVPGRQRRAAAVRPPRRVRRPGDAVPRRAEARRGRVPEPTDGHRGRGGRAASRPGEAQARLEGSMIDFELNDEQKAVESAVRDWAAREVAPKIHDLDREHRFERGFLKGMAELHLLGLCIPESYGGAGLDYVSLGLACEELEYVDTHLRVIMSVHVGLNTMTLWCWGTEEQKKKYLVPQAKGEKIATYGLTEPNAG